MTRLLTTMRCDFTVQWRNGFYAATAVVTAVWLLAAVQAPFDLRWLLPPLLVGNLMVGTFYFLAGLVLLEKDERTPLALATTPLRHGEYLGSKIITLSGLALAETLLLAGVLAGWRLSPLPLLVGTLLASIIYCLVGALAVARYHAINQFLLPSALVLALLWLPLLAYLAGWQHPLLLLHPFGGPLLLVEAAFFPQPPAEIALALLAGVGWVSLFWRWAFVSSSTQRRGDAETRSC
ncbi:MAG: ABC transporter permease [Chloroflexaceae bacterium]|jgi:fluoroquinolone transport system permease protein|nr:ABC transporter permease [Chloroflexaceae bacterium]